MKSIYEENIINFANTPLSVCIYSVKEKALRMHEVGMLEIIFCLRGSVTHAYAYEEFTLKAGEYVSVDRDAYYLYGDGDNMCVSFYINLLEYENKYPDIKNHLFVCEACDTGTAGYPNEHYERLHGKLITLLKILLEKSSAQDGKLICSLVESIVDMFMEHFDIAMYHCKQTDLKPEIMKRSQEVYMYLAENYLNKITLADMASKLGLTEGYLSEFIRKYSIGFIQLLAYHRANKSEWYLINTDHTIVEISEACGFSDTQYYYKAFKKWYKCTPKQFRDKYVTKKHDDIKCYKLDGSLKEMVDELLIKHYIDMFK